MVLCIRFLLLVLSASAAKYFWYEAPIYPLCALLAGAGLALVAEAFIRHSHIEARPWLLLVLLVCLFAAPAKRIWDEAFYTDGPDMLLGKHIRHQAKEFGQITSYTLLAGILYNSSMEFYRLAAIRNYGHTVLAAYS